MTLKIIEGEFGSRVLETPADASQSRPYAGRLRNSVFNQLRGWFEGANVFELCAGVGTVGLEAVSRGAAKVVMIEQSREIFAILKRNIAALGCASRATAVCQDAFAESALIHAPALVTLAFVDPPFEMMTTDSSRRRVLRQIARLRSVMAVESFVILRSPIGPPEADFAVEGFGGPEVQQHKREHWVMIYAPTKQLHAMAGEDSA